MNIKIKLYKTGILILQCKRCQSYEHTQKFYQRNLAYVKCAGNHLTATCTKPNNNLIIDQQSVQSALIVRKLIQQIVEVALLPKNCKKEDSIKSQRKKHIIQKPSYKKNN